MLPFLLDFRFRKYFIRVLVFLPRLLCCKDLGKEWEGRSAGHRASMPTRHFNGTTGNFDSAVSNGGVRSALDRCRSFNENLGERSRRDVTFEVSYGNSLTPLSRNRRPSSCVSKCDI